MQNALQRHTTKQNEGTPVKIAIITTCDEGYHKYFCATLAKRYQLVGMLHPVRAQGSGGLLDLSAHKRSIGKYGLAYHLLLKLGANKLKRFGWDLASDVAASEAAIFPNAEADYAAIAGLAKTMDDINGPESVAYLRGLGADVVLVSGGPIYRAPLLEAVPLVLNYHTGISPIYNGSESIFWPYVNGHPQVTGGTLMIMNTGIDAGDMLAHYLPAIAAGDTPGRLFMKTFKGGIDLYCRFLDHLAAGKPYVSAPQGRPLHYTVSAEWSVHQSLILERRVKQDICKKFARDSENCSVYWDQPDRAAAILAAKAFLTKMIYDV
jgi:folate-dependent phosphoribosylglycinamide formyltransferase PurN